MKIAIKGYYGFGNLGDDVLMLSTINLVRSIFPSCELYVCTESAHPNYIFNWDTDLKIISSQTNLEVEWIFHGGGGVYFDFKNSSLVYGLLNSFIRFIGYKNFTRLYRIQRILKNNPGVKACHRAGIGIGIGDFTRTSTKFYVSIQSLSNYDILFVRDNDSFKRLCTYKFKYPYFKSTDLAFHTSGWLPQKLEVYNEESQTISMILRDWTYDQSSYLEGILSVADSLINEGFKVRFFSFDPNNDKQYISKISMKYDMLVWDPASLTLEYFINELSRSKLVITSRAHGAIISACLGIPGICLKIEPKLKTIASMLKNSYLLLDDADSNQLLAFVKKLCKNYEHYKSQAEKDVSLNVRQLSDSIGSLKDFVYERMPR